MSTQATPGLGVGSNALLGELTQTAEMLETYAPECFPADENGRVHFARAMMESAALVLRAADAEIARLRALNDWQPIATAPTDGTSALLVDAKGRAEIGRWAEFCRYNVPGFTHWMPLPLPPNAEVQPPSAPGANHDE